ncbi:hypothetical protein ACNOYE_32805 [Nannocystaceae bacterium ST9]
MWDPDQLAAIEVEIDRLLLAGDPLGEWLAIRMRLDSDPIAPEERASLRHRASSLREQLGPALVLADDPALGRPAAIRERGLIVDVGFDAANPGRLAALLARPDARFLLHLRLRGDTDMLLGCADMLTDRRAATRPAWLRLLDFELPSAGELDGKDPDAEAEAARLRLIAGLFDRRPALLANLEDLFSLTVDDHPLQLEVGVGKPRTRIGRALGDPDPELKRAALDQLVGQGRLASSLRVPLIRLITREADPELRQRALHVIDAIVGERTTLLTLLGEWARDHEDLDLREWLAAKG